jgi:hypothetical protein
LLPVFQKAGEKFLRLFIFRLNLIFFICYCRCEEGTYRQVQHCVAYIAESKQIISVDNGRSKGIAEADPTLMSVPSA